MEQFIGKVIFEAIAEGPVFVYQKEQRPVLKGYIQDAEAEIERFWKALEQAKASLCGLCEKVAMEDGKSGEEILQCHRMLLEDEEYLNTVCQIIQSKKMNAESAVAAAEKKFIIMFASMKDEYLQERVEDIKDISRRLIRILQGTPEKELPKQPVILYARELSPSEMLSLDQTKLLAIVMETGGIHSHTAILARHRGIPTLTGVQLPEYAHGKKAILDGHKGLLILEPAEEVLAEYRKRKAKEEEEGQALQACEEADSQIAIYANIDCTDDMEAVLKNGAEGIGLFRSEFMYLEAEAYPSEEELFQAYKLVAEKMNGKRVIIRTLDIGADKQTDYFCLKQEENPAMGMRGIRISLTRPELFKTQLRAILRASVYGTVAVMFPMITSLWELKEARKLLKEAQRELTGEGISFKDIETGVMIETPAAVMISDLLAKEADFFSIGTNDLTQYTLAADRQNQQMNLFYDVHHEAILRMIEMTVKNAHKEKIRVGICGELGADMELTQRFWEMGVDELSVSPSHILHLRRLMKKFDKHLPM